MKRTTVLLGAVAAVIAGATVLTSWRQQSLPATASSHREAPLIASDPQADGTDLYAFVSPDRPDTVTIIADYIPLEAPDGGPNFYTFGDDVSYRIHIDNNGDAEADITYEFRFKTETRNPGTFLYNTGPVASLDDPNLNVRQTWTLARMQEGSNNPVIGQGVVAPYNAGPNSFPDYDRVADQAITDVDGGIRVFAGPRDDPFWVDLAIFDLLKPGSPPMDSLAGYNVHSIVMQIPIENITRSRIIPTGPTDPNAVIGVWTTAWRPQMQIFNPDGSRTAQGDMVQVSRLGMPLVNEVVAPRGAKDLFNASNPRDDAQFLKAVTDPELATLFNAVLGFPAPTTGRDDLVAVFLTGVPGLNMPDQVKPAEMLRLNLAIPPSANPNRMGVLGGDTAGFPNGRRLTDDVVDIALQVVAGILPPFNMTAASAITQGVPFNDVPFLNTFPYVASPHPGNK